MSSLGELTPLSGVRPLSAPASGQTRVPGAPLTVPSAGDPEGPAVGTVTAPGQMLTAETLALGVAG